MLASLLISAPALIPDSLIGMETLDGVPALTLSAHTTSPQTIAAASHVSLTLTLGDQERAFDLLCAEVRRLPDTGVIQHYGLTLRPWLWWLTLARNNRIFQNKTTAEIVTAVFDEHGFSDYSLKLTGTYKPREYCVQYNETDFDFVSRLLEEEGIFYFFTHAKGKHTLVLGDDTSAFPPCPNAETIPWLSQKVGERELHGIRSAQVCEQVVPAFYAAADHAFATPTVFLYSKTQAGQGTQGVYEHPGGYAAKAEGDALGAKRVQALQAHSRRLIGESDCRWLVPGHWFTLIGHDDDTLNIKWLVTTVTHDAGPDYYRNTFEAIPFATPYRPSRTTPKPVMHPQIATVVGKDGEEIWTDEHGRIKIRFPWDRGEAQAEACSCWVRVVTPWSGTNFGAQFLPRIGQEVVISFIDGNPDRPLVTGCVYNGANPPPYPLPANQTQSGIKTQSSKGGGGFNELRFEDKKDNEEVFLQAQKDLALNVLNDAKATIGHDDILTVKNDRTRTVQEGNDTTIVEKGDRSVTISTGNDALSVKDSRTVSVKGDQTHTIGGNDAHTIDGNYTLTVKGNLTIKVSGTVNLESDGAFVAKAGGALTVESDSSVTSKAGSSLTNQAGTSLTNKAGTSLTNKAGTTLTNDAGVSMTNKAAAAQTVDGGGMLTLKGGIIKAN